MTFDNQSRIETRRDTLNPAQRRTFSQMDAKYGRETAEHWAEQTQRRQPDLIPQDQIEFNLFAERVGGR